MAVNRRPARLVLWLHLAVRLLGVTGLLAAGVGGLLAAPELDRQFGQVGGWPTDFRPAALPQTVRVAVDTVAGVARAVAAAGDLELAAVLMMLIGLGLALLMVLVEAVATAFRAAGRRSAAGLNFAFQIALAVVLLVIVNWFSSEHYRRFDWTADRQFTLDPQLVEQLRRLGDQPTTIIVFQQHKTFSQLSAKPDAYDYAAERKVVEKVKDLAARFAEFGPQFKVSVLDVEEEGYNAKLEKLSAEVPGLRAAIDAAPENSIFFAANGRVQRLSFNEFYQLDKTASKEADDGRGNLVLLSQGVGPFARRVLSIEERKPRVCVAVIHEWLTTQAVGEDTATFTLAGLGKALTANGFEVRDLVLKKWNDPDAPEPVPTAYSFEESKLDRLDEELTDLDLRIRRFQRVRWVLGRLKSSATLGQLAKELEPELRGQRIDEASRRLNVELLEAQMPVIDRLEAEATEERKKLEAERQPLLAREDVTETRRLRDVRAKLDRLLADCDLLIVPRLTIRDLNAGQRGLIPPRLHALNAAQVEAVKAFLKAGKPVLACFGPANEPTPPPAPGREPEPTLAPPDGLERLLGDLGIVFGRQTLLYNAEQKAFAERRTQAFGGTVSVELPPLSFGPDNPIGAGMRIAARSVGDKFDLKAPRYARPVYFVPPVPGRATGAEFLFTSEASWNEDRPFPAGDYTPAYEPVKAGDPRKGTRDEERTGPFPVGVAVETRLPADWYDDHLRALEAARMVFGSRDAVGAAGAVPAGLAAALAVPSDDYAPNAEGAKRARARVAAVGHGGLFIGPELPPAKERLLVYTCNWLLGRGERLPTEGLRKEFPRVTLSADARARWTWGALLGLPALFAYLGMVMYLVRRVR